MRLMRPLVGGHRRPALLVVAITSLTAVVLAGCGSSASSSSNAASATPDAQTLLRETFSGNHPVSSGQIELAVHLVPAGSSLLTTPITIAFGGPFQSAGKGKLPESDFTVTASAQGQSGKLSIISTGSAGYITINGDSFQLPAATYDKLKSGLSSVTGSSSTPSAGSTSTPAGSTSTPAGSTSTPAGSTSTPAGSTSTSSASPSASMLGKLGIDPLNWLSDPQVVGLESVGGVNTDHISAKVNVAGLLRDLAKLAGSASSLGISGANNLSGGLTASEQSSIAAHVSSPSFDIWTGASDQTLRKLAVALTVPVTGTLHTELGGLSSLRITVDLQYADLNQPQTITAPTKLLPYSEFQTQLASDMKAIESGIASSALGGTSTNSGSGSGSSSGSTTTGGSGSGSSSGSSGAGLSGAEERYAECIVKAAGDVVKQQACSSILGG
jgi:hypothetical protein